MQKKIIVTALTGVALLLGACAYIPRPGPVGNRAVLQPARSVDLNKYMGRWYEQFRYEASFERDMDDVTAEYSLNDDRRLRRFQAIGWQSENRRSHDECETESFILRAVLRELLGARP